VRFPEEDARATPKFYADFNAENARPTPKFYADFYGEKNARIYFRYLELLFGTARKKYTIGVQYLQVCYTAAPF
jgi:hypothetical protein